ncbi:MAG: hypothetical protein P8Q14_10215, partial [Vicingaceae bacterium]|nr:hypothetical protein [Vicingaceae bacterium]
MDNYYQILNLKPKVKENDIYNSFKTKLNLVSNNQDKICKLFKAYIILSGPPKKFYDILRDQEEKGSQLKKKYFNI